MKKLIKYYIDLMNKYILVKAGTILLILILILQITSFFNKKDDKEKINENLVFKNTIYSTDNVTVIEIDESYFYN